MAECCQIDAETQVKIAKGVTAAFQKTFDKTIGFPTSHERFTTLLVKDAGFAQYLGEDRGPNHLGEVSNEFKIRQAPRTRYLAESPVAKGPRIRGDGQGNAGEPGSVRTYPSAD